MVGCLLVVIVLFSGLGVRVEEEVEGVGIIPGRGVGDDTGV